MGELSQNYSRDALQEKYPGFGTEWIPVGQKENGEFIIGYFAKDVDDGRFIFSPEPQEVVTFTLFTRYTSPKYDKTLMRSSQVSICLALSQLCAHLSSLLCFLFCASPGLFYFKLAIYIFKNITKYNLGRTLKVLK